MQWLEYVLSIVAGLAAAIPLVIKLIEYVKKSIREKNWPEMLKMVMGFMEIAEKKFEDGETKKAFVMSMVAASAEKVNYDIDMNVVSEMIDSLCDLSKEINVEVSKAIEA